MAKGYSGYYPGMLSAEAQIWEAFMQSGQATVTNPDYNVRVGMGRDPGPTYADFVRKAAIANSQLRLDVVAQNANGWTIYEVKQRCRAGAVGQLLQYKLLYLDAFPNNLPLTLAIVTDLPTLNLDRLCASQGITLYTQPVIFTSPST